MIKGMAVLGIALAVVLISTPAAFAKTPEFCIFGICIGGGDHGGFGSGDHGGFGGGPNPVPAPLLAAGLPAFTALGGGVLISRLIRKFRSRA